MTSKHKFKKKIKLKTSRKASQLKTSSIAGKPCKKLQLAGSLLEKKGCLGRQASGHSGGEQFDALLNALESDSSHLTLSRFIFCRNTKSATERLEKNGFQIQIDQTLISFLLMLNVPKD